ncbi:MAG: T9SS type A sorting domain-containing protein [Candidatus Kapaibacterium sp.]
MANLTRASVYYGVDIRHCRFAPEADRSGVQRVVLGAIDFLDQYSAVLPVEVSEFTAYQTGREAVTVQWATVSEKEISGLEIERSEVVRSESGESLVGSQVIAQRVPEGGPEKVASYSVLDGTVRQGAEYEYRLISIEKDGRRVVAARGRVLVTGGAESSYSLSVYPNPASEYSRISWRAPRGVASSLLMVDAEGKVVREEELSVDGTGELRIDVTGLSSGVYHIRLMSGTEVLTQTLTVQK